MTVIPGYWRYTGGDAWERIDGLKILQLTLDDQGHTANETLT
jgi:hypothetical protein